MKRFVYYGGIFTIAAATLLLEVAFTRLFSVIFFNPLVFLIISTALFGFGLSGVLLSIFPRLSRYNLDKMLWGLSLAFSLSVIAALKVVVGIPIEYRSIWEGEPRQIFYVLVHYLFLTLPFLFSGMVVALLLSKLPQKVSKLYFFDLIGAGLGCFLVLPLVPLLGGQGAILGAALLGLVGGFVFSLRLGKISSFISLLLLVGVAFLLPGAERHFSLPIRHIFKEKHGDFYQAPRRPIETTRWSALSRIDVIDIHPYKLIYIDGGSNVSFMIPFQGGDFSRLKPRINWRSMPYLLKEKPEVLVIGPAGGEEVLCALSLGAKKVIGVELDPAITHLVTHEYRQFIGNIYNNPRVELITDEGRSYVRRSKEKFDIIHQIHSVSPIAIASGAMNLSETYLLTVEAINDYLDHLKEDGILAINRWGVVRMVSLAVRALEERGVANPGDHIVVLEGLRSGTTSGFFLKNSPFTPEELEIFRRYAPPLRYSLVYSPDRKRENELYYSLIDPTLREKLFAHREVNLQPVSDDKPFFNHFLRFGKLKLTSPELLDKGMAVVQEHASVGDIILFVVLGEVSVLSLIFIFLPLYFFNRTGLRSPYKGSFLLYFCCLGLGFILVEISLIQKFVLFMGHPLYSITTVLFSLLVFAGIGSYLSGRFRRPPQRALKTIIPGIGGLVILLLLLSPPLFNRFLGVATPLRFIISLLMLAPLGLLMGMPFPLGIQMVNRHSPKLIPWVWGVNGYFTVMGSILSVIFALCFGFRFVLITASCIYLVGLSAIMGITTGGEV